MRSFRVERIRAADELLERFDRPHDFDLKRYWTESSAEFARASRTVECIVTLRVPTAALDRFTTYWPAEVTELGEFESIVRVRFPGTDPALYQTLAWCDVATAVEPVELRDAVVARAQQALQWYQVRSSNATASS